ncbi:MAG TPA: carboxypeptidase M32, partial [Nitrosomonas sp.]|nr:carboxypeptidase M32 [Nitrosomonas sp.]
LGAMYACQFYHPLLKDFPDIEQQIACGNFAPIREWLNDRIHRQGRLFTPQELVVKITGEPLNPDYFIGYVNSKYAEIYDLAS